MATWSPPDQIHTHQQISLPFLFLQLYVTNNYNCHFKGSKLPFLIHLFYSQATLAVCVCVRLSKLLLSTLESERERETKIARECGLLAEKGHLGFHLLPQLKMLLKGLMGLVSLLLLQVLFILPP